MSTILAAVGRGAINRTDDVRLVQALLNKHRQAPQRPLALNGVVGPQMIAAIEDFQRRAMQMPRPDGRVDPGGQTFAALLCVPVHPMTP